MTLLLDIKMQTTHIQHYKICNRRTVLTFVKKSKGKNPQSWIIIWTTHEVPLASGRLFTSIRRGHLKILQRWLKTPIPAPKCTFETPKGTASYEPSCVKIVSAIFAV